MALEYALYGDADLTTDEILSFMVNAIGGTIVDNYARRGALDVTAYREDPGDESPAGDLLGFTHRISATFRLSNRASLDERDQHIAIMVRAVLEFFDHYPGAGVLLHNDAQVVLMRIDGPVIFDTDWAEWTTDLAELRTVVAGHPVQSLPQPLL